MEHMIAEALRSEGNDNEMQMPDFLNPDPDNNEETAAVVEDSLDDASGSKKRNRKDLKTCVVCGDTALGCNFDAISCESCKAFFRRNALKDKKTKCVFSGSCNIDVTTRKFCPHCRLIKCFAVGMKKELILGVDERNKRMQKVMKNREDRTPQPRKRARKSNESAMDNMDDQLQTSPHMSLPPSPLSESYLFSPVNSPTAALQNTTVVTLPLPIVKQEDHVIEYVINGQEVKHVLNSNDITKRLSMTPPPPPTTYTPPSTVTPPPPTQMPFTMPTLDDVVMNAMHAVHASQQFMQVNPAQGQSLPPATSTPMSMHLFPRSIASSLTSMASSLSAHHSQNPSSTGASTPASQALHDEILALGSLPTPQPSPPTTSTANCNVTTPGPAFVPMPSVSPTSYNLPPGSGTAALTNSSMNLLNATSDMVMPEVPASFAPNGVPTGPSEDQRRQLTAEEDALLKDLVQMYDLSFTVDHEPIVHIKQIDPSLNQLVNQSSITVLRIIKFAKRLEEFASLPQECQIGMLKGTWIHILLLRSVSMYDCERDLWVTPRGAGIPTEILKNSTGFVQLHDDHVNYCKAIKTLVRDDITLITIMVVIVLFSPEGPHVWMPALISNVQDKYLLILKHYIEYKFGYQVAAQMFPELVHKLKELKELAEIHGKYLLNINPREIEPIMLEILDLK